MYEDLADDNAFGRRARWGYSGMTHDGPLVLLGEVGAGTDIRQESAVAGSEEYGENQGYLQVHLAY